MAEKKYLTLKELKEMGACRPARREFRKSFGARATVSQVVKRLHELKADAWEIWLLSQTLELTASALKYGANVHVGNDSFLHRAKNLGCVEMLKILKMALIKSKKG